MKILDCLTEGQKAFYQEKCQSDDQKRFFWKKACQRNIKILTYILGYRDLGKFHDKLLIDISRDFGTSIRRFWLWARGHFKTSLITESHTIYLIINNPNIRVLIVSNTLEIAKSMLKNIKGHFIQNDDFRWIFPEFCPKANREGKIEFGTTEQFTVPNRTRFLKEYTVQCAGIGTNLTGLHFDWMKIDDLVTKDSVTNDTQIQASKDYYASLRQLYDKPTEPKEDVIGTTYHFNDLYASIKKHPSFTKSIIPAKKEGIISFPERFSREGLDGILNDPTVGPYQFNAQYLLNPVNPEERKFQEDWLYYYTHDELPEGLSQYICVDPASTQKKKSDFTVVQRWGVDSEGVTYLLEGIRDKLTVFQRINTIVRFVRNSKNLKEVKYEVLGGRHGDLEALRAKFEEEKIPISPQETKSTTSSKIDRIEQRLVGPYHAKKIKLPYALNFKSLYDGKVYNFVELLKLEFLQFPFSEHDDILDCQSQLFEEQLMKGKAKKRGIPEKEYTAGDEEREYQIRKKMFKQNPFLTKEGLNQKLFIKKLVRI